MSVVVIDTNVLMVADGQAQHMSLACQQNCIRRLEDIRAHHNVALDYARMILGEYQCNISINKQPTPGSAFLKWLIVTANRTEWVTITHKNNDPAKFNEFPDDDALEAAFDPSDRKFVAVANAHHSKPPILQATDSKWLGWETSLAQHGILVEMVCRDELVRIRERKLAN